MIPPSPSQLPLRFQHRPSLQGEDFLVAPCNAEAVAWIDRWPDWPAPALVLCGPADCGKTHLASVFAAASGARSVAAEDLATAAASAAASAPACVLEDAEDLIAGRADAEAGAFHLYNVAAERGRRLLLTARRPPSRWPLALADLRSRLNAAVTVEIGAPDDALLGAVLVKLFADRQLRVGEDVVAFLVTRMERSFEAARRTVAALDAAALAERRKITVPLAGRVLETLRCGREP